MPCCSSSHEKMMWVKREFGFVTDFSVLMFWTINCTAHVCLWFGPDNQQPSGLWGSGCRSCLLPGRIQRAHSLQAESSTLTQLGLARPTAAAERTRAAAEQPEELTDPPGDRHSPCRRGEGGRRRAAPGSCLVTQRTADVQHLRPARTSLCRRMMAQCTSYQYPRGATLS